MNSSLQVFKSLLECPSLIAKRNTLLMKCKAKEPILSKFSHIKCLYII